jgi:hypothetical protein
MKKTPFSILISLILLLGLADRSSGAEEQTSPVGFETQMKAMMEGMMNSMAQGLSMDPNAIAATDPNAGQFSGKELAEVDKDLKRVRLSSKDELREWTSNTDENKVDLAKAVQKQIETELEFLGKIAAEEGCGKTCTAIERLLAMRQEQFAKLIETIEKKSQRRSGRMERRGQRQDQSVDPVRGGGDNDTQQMNREERRKAWELRRQQQRDQRLQERNARKSSVTEN